MKSFINQACIFVIFTILASCENIGISFDALDGQLVARVDSTIWASNSASAISSHGITVISATNKDGQVITAVIDGETEGLYALGQNESNAMAFSLTTDGSVPAYSSNSHEEISGFLEITKIDTVKSLISGQFNVELFRPNDSTFMNFTDGRFTNLEMTQDFSVPPDAQFRATIDGETWSPDFILANIQVEELVISGLSGSKSIAISVPIDVENGSYNLGSPLFSSYGGMYTANSSTIILADTGSLTITKHDTNAKLIEGSFAFEGTEMQGDQTASITEGYFLVTY